MIDWSLLMNFIVAFSIYEFSKTIIKGLFIIWFESRQKKIIPESYFDGYNRVKKAMSDIDELK